MFIKYREYIYLFCVHSLRHVEEGIHSLVTVNHKQLDQLSRAKISQIINLVIIEIDIYL